MKKLKISVTILFLSLILAGMTSCEISRHAQNGKHKGWFHKHNDHRDHKDAIIIPLEIKDKSHTNYDQD